MDSQNPSDTNAASGFPITCPIPCVRAKGTHFEIGQQIGEAVRPQVQHSIENARNLITGSYSTLGLDWDGALIQARKYLPFAQERYMPYVDELAGIAEGADVSFDDLAVLNAMEAVTMDALHLTKCTSLAVNEDRTADGHVLVAHNEDWLPEDEQDVFILHAEPEKEPPFLAMTYGGLLPNIGFNAYGVAQACDSVYPTDSRIGIPRVFVSRAVLSAHNLEDAVRSALVPQRAAGYNTFWLMKAASSIRSKYPPGVLPSCTPRTGSSCIRTITSIRRCSRSNMSRMSWSGRDCDIFGRCAS